MAQREYPRQPRRPIRRDAAPATVATRGSLALSDPVVGVNPYQSGAQIYPTGSTNPGNVARSPNPPVDEISATTPNLKNYGATGTSFFGGIIQSDEYNPEFSWRDGIIKYEQMSRNDSQIFAIKQQVEQPILAAKWSIEPASSDPIDQEIASLVQSCLFDDMCYTTTDGTEVYQSWSETLRQILMFKWYGFSLFEKCFRIEDGWVKWSRFLPLLPRTVWRWYVGADNELEAVEQWAYKEWTYQYNRIPRGKLIHFANRMEGQNYQGISTLRSAFANWWYKQQFLKIAAIEIERNAIIPPVIKMGPLPSADEVSAALKLTQNIRANEQLGVVIGHDMEFSYPRMTERGAAQILPLIEYHDNMIARNILGQFINLGSHEVGSYALAQQQVTNFLGTLQSDCAYVCDIINHQAIRQLVDYNYDGVANYPKLTCSRLVAQDITTLSTALQYLTSYIPPSPEVNDAIADALGLPKPPASMVETTNPTSPSDPARPGNARADDHANDAGQQVEGHASGGGGGTSGTTDYQDTDGGAGFSESSEHDEPQSLREFRLLRESLDAFNAHVSGAGDAVERGTRYLLGGHEPGYEQNRDAHGHWAPGEGGSGEHEGKGSGRGRGGNGSGGAEGEHAPKASRSSGGGARSSGGRGKAAKAEKPAKEPHKAKGEDAVSALMSGKSVTVRDENGDHLVISPTSHDSRGIGFQVHSVTRIGAGGKDPILSAHGSEEKLRDTVGKLEHLATHNTRDEAFKAAKNSKEGLEARLAKLEYEHNGHVRSATSARADHERNAPRIGNLYRSHLEAAQAYEKKADASQKSIDATRAKLAKLEHEAKAAPKSSSSSAKGKASGKSEEERTAAKAAARTARSEKAKTERLEAARQRVKDAEQERHIASTEHNAGIKGRDARVTNVTDAAMVRRNEAVDQLVKAQQSLAKMEGRHLHPAERGITREEFLQGKGRYIGRRSDGSVGIIHVSSEEAHAWLNGGNKEPFKEPGKASSKSAKSTKGEGKLSAKAQMERDLETIRGVRPIREMSREEARQWNRSGLLDITRTSNPWQMHSLFGHAAGRQLIGAMGTKELRNSASKMESYLASKGQQVSIRGKTRDALAKRISDVVEQHPQAPFDINDF